MAAAGRPLGHGVEPAYFSQHEVEARRARLGARAAAAATGLQRPQAQALLGRFLFSGWDAHEKPVVALSGGERRRLALALVVASGANFLVLDEPTNHLDLESREALEAALEAFPGTVLLVSHDRALLDAVAERILAIEDGTLAPTTAAGPTTCAARRGGRRRRRESAAGAGGAKPRRPSAAAQPSPSELELVEAEIAAREERVAELERALAEDWANVDVSPPTGARATSSGAARALGALFESAQLAP